MNRLHRIQEYVNDAEEMVCVVVSDDWNTHLRAAGLGPSRHPATCECAQCEERREAADASYGDPAYEEMSGPAERSA